MDEAEIAQLKWDFLSIKEKYTYKAITDLNLSNMKADYDNLFYKYRLTNFKYVLQSNAINGIFAFTPIGRENILLLRGILA